MDRRKFLSLMGLVTPAVIVRPKYFLSPLGGWIQPPLLATTYEDYTRIFEIEVEYPSIPPQLFEYQKMLMTLAELFTAAPTLASLRGGG